MLATPLYMKNPGEEVVGSYLRYVLDCDFVDYNPSTRFTQGEIDVVGINSAKEIIYICEVATHLETGVQYVGIDKRPDNISRFTKKFEKNIEYANRYFKKFEKQYMLWSPIVKRPQKVGAHDQVEDIVAIQKIIRERYGVDLRIIINEDYMKCIDSLRKAALEITEEIKTPIMRFLQIDEKLKVHLVKQSGRS